MKIVKMVVISTLVSAVSLTAMASTTGETEIEGYGPGSMPMMQGQQGQGGMPMMNMMREKQAMMQTHMKTMETHMANIEALLQQLVELQKK